MGTRARLVQRGNKKIIEVRPALIDGSYECGSPGPTRPIVAGEGNDGRLGNYTDRATAREALLMHASRWVTIPTANTTDTVHTSSFECRATLFQRLFASPSDFDLVCREFLADGNQSKL